ncbi:hypothetical protein NYP20_28815 [Pseudomonas sp. N3-W]|uniref:hypothetical protein n=1 Tax=Pseudomonas sp. N3-W TaxID=2975049 RepID=UPI00217E2D55|nr:hypothetical protein [Pseudomonas sp. N3-W]UWF49238.1 hypothetical protein NYP20_28815 [Pseudomonas sp. N3-W]
MKEKCGRYVLAAMCLISTSAFSSNLADTVVNVGDETGYSAFASGKTVAAIHQGNCNYSMVLLENQYVKFNTPDVVFLESNTKPTDNSWPYLEQAEMSAGYDWSFKKNGDPKSKWFGLMCDGIEDFDLQGSPVSIDSENISPELQDIKQANSLKCPATLTASGWVPTKNAGRPEEYIFQQLTGTDWSGFMFGFKNRDKDSFARISFCLVQGNNVLIGAAGNGSKQLSLDHKILDEIKMTLESVKFPQ